MGCDFYAQSTVELADRLEDSAAKGQLEMFHHGDMEKLEQAIESVIKEFVERGWFTVSQGSGRTTSSSSIAGS